MTHKMDMPAFTHWEWPCFGRLAAGASCTAGCDPGFHLVGGTAETHVCTDPLKPLYFPGIHEPQCAAEKWDFVDHSYRRAAQELVRGVVCPGGKPQLSGRLIYTTFELSSWLLAKAKTRKIFGANAIFSCRSCETNTRVCFVRRFDRMACPLLPEEVAKLDDSPQPMRVYMGPNGPDAGRTSTEELLMTYWAENKDKLGGGSAPMEICINMCKASYKCRWVFYEEGAEETTCALFTRIPSCMKASARLGGGF